MTKRSKSLSLSEELLKQLKQIQLEEHKKAVLTNNNPPSFSEIVEELLWKVLKNRKT